MASSFHMRSADLIKKEPLDSGGFGEVYLCYHATLGQVVMKTLYTGPLRSEDSKKSLLEEGNIMASLNHERVVKLLGVIMEDRDCSLVMELLPRGNLLLMLERVSVPISIKGRIILEILEGMVYLTERHVVHKDIKPENILVDKDFHIKIADLGLATCKTWSKLTRQESRRKSRGGQTAGARGAGTLSYMAPEHLESIHAPSTEKSDVYSFAIVVWVILTGQEPYANARSEDQMSQCVRNGDRPEEDLIPEDTPMEIIQLMKRCWDQNPERRPSFKEAYSCFLPFYREKLDPCVEKDLCALRSHYEGPDELIEKMKSLSVTNECFLASEHDCPAPLLSSDRGVPMPVEASIEDLHDIQHDTSRDCVQTDARAHNNHSSVQDKLDRELQYHKHGSYNREIPPDVASVYHTSTSNPFLPIRQPAQDRSSVQIWDKAEPVQPISQGEPSYWPNPGLVTPTPSYLATSVSAPSFPQFNQQQPQSQIYRQQSCPVPDTLGPDLNTGGLFAPSCSTQDTGSLYIQNASGIQIGSNNKMSIIGYDKGPGSLCPSGNSAAVSSMQEAILKYEDHAVKEEHLDLLRENIGSSWKICARNLGLSNVEIEIIEHDYCRDGLPEIVHQMLERWKMKEGFIGCTIGKLCRALKGIIKVEVIQKILDTCSFSTMET
ncbi:receptor-interacting serine/threonine-protein kinase 1 [Cololabis saira]|uniref:receptor-interacting serine/threonine-protein kinase 1 n=1 Tax=Cololabis saira TaxID=129043 RepID=UPI002AD2708D|nr:receptor-interacting serine/threonine-protein kinase 1 [Cololabis saira]XP_061588359.1 receptor-interacting serine/threonine-protein kinase 1 [Cololabis saira]